MRILISDLAKGTISEIDEVEGEGLSLGLSLLECYGEDSFVLSAPTLRSIELSNSSVFTISYYSPITHKKAFGYANLSLGLSMVMLGIKAIVFVGKSPVMCFLSIYQAKEEILPCESMRGKEASYFEEVMQKNILDSVLSSSRAADNGIKFTDLTSKGKYVYGLGLGYVFSQHNLKGIVMQGFNSVSPSSRLSRKARRRIEKSRFARMVRKHGANIFVDDALRLGWLPVFNFSSGFDPRAYALDGKSVLERYGNFPDSCQECFFSCGRRGKKEEIVPTWNEVMMLGTNLGFFSFESIQPIADKAREEGIDVNTLGAILSFLFTLNDDQRDFIGLRDKTPESVVRFISSISDGRGVGAVLQDGLVKFNKAVQTELHMPISYDLRGAYNQAIVSSLNLDILLPGGTLFPKKPLKSESAAVMAFYELIYTFALINYGFIPLLRLGVFYSSFKKRDFGLPVLLRMKSRRFSIFGLSSRELLRKGLEIADMLSLELTPLPSVFELYPGKNKRNLPTAKLLSLFQSEYRRALSFLKSSSDSIDAFSSSRSANVGPEEERG